MDNSEKEFKRYVLLLAIAWTLLSLFPLTNLFQGIVNDLGPESFAMKIGLSTLLGPFFPVYENTIEPSIPFPLSAAFGISAGVFLLVLICLPKFKNNPITRMTGVFAISLWCLTGCGEAIRFVT